MKYTQMKAKELVQCSICSRRFTGDRIKIHEAICQKSVSIKRQAFDVSEQRINGTDIENFLKTTPKAAAFYENNKKRSSTLSTDWRWQHNEFIKKIQLLKEQVLASKRSSSSKKESQECNDFIQCPHCRMKFSQPAAQRHITICAKMTSEK